MYQTVGQDAIEFVAAAFDLPIVRRVIAGTAVQQSSEYGERKALSSVTGDETEDMYELLLTVKVETSTTIGKGVQLSHLACL